jgi:hypothetical protein
VESLVIRYASTQDETRTGGSDLWPGGNRMCFQKQKHQIGFFRVTLGLCTYNLETWKSATSATHGGLTAFSAWMEGETEHGLH